MIKKKVKFLIECKIIGMDNKDYSETLRNILGYFNRNCGKSIIMEETKLRYDKINWKIFKRKEIIEAQKFAKNGGIAIHLMGDATQWLNEKSSKQTVKNFKGKDFAHMFGPCREILIHEAVSIGCKSNWIQHQYQQNRMHFDLTGKILNKAIKKCEDKNASKIIKAKNT